MQLNLKVAWRRSALNGGHGLTQRHGPCPACRRRSRPRARRGAPPCGSSPSGWRPARRLPAEARRAHRENTWREQQKAMIEDDARRDHHADGEGRASRSSTGPTWSSRNIDEPELTRGGDPSKRRRSLQLSKPRDVRGWRKNSPGAEDGRSTRDGGHQVDDRDQRLAQRQRRVLGDVQAIADTQGAPRSASCDHGDQDPESGWIAATPKWCGAADDTSSASVVEKAEAHEAERHLAARTIRNVRISPTMTNTDQPDTRRIVRKILSPVDGRETIARGLSSGIAVGKASLTVALHCSGHGDIPCAFLLTPATAAPTGQRPSILADWAGPSAVRVQCTNRQPRGEQRVNKSHLGGLQRLSNNTRDRAPAGCGGTVTFALLFSLPNGR